jgi:microcin C transport system permease protein
LVVENSKIGAGMRNYFLRRLLLLLPTLFGITVICFVIINMAPGGPLDAKISQMKMMNLGASSSIPDAYLQELKKQYGFDQPLTTRYFLWLKNLATFNFGNSVKFDAPVTDVLLEKLPVSLEFAFVSIVIIYLISIPLGVRKAVYDGTSFDLASTAALMVLYAVPPLVMGILLRSYFAGGSFLDIFPVSELYSDNYQDLSLLGKLGDRLMHFVLPLICYVANGFVTITLLTKNSLLEEVRLDYVRTARAKGLAEKKVVYKHALRNALVPLVTGLGSFLTLFFGGSLIIEQVFNLDGIGLLGIHSLVARDYNVIMALIFFQALISLFGRLLTDFVYVVVDPRMDFE